jgi:SRSO17 transposase
MPRLNPRTTVLVVGSGVNPWSETVSYCGAQNRQLPVVATTALLADQLAWPTTMEPFLLEDWAEDADRRARASPQVTDRLDACAEVRVPGIQIDSVLADAAYGNHHA